MPPAIKSSSHPCETWLAWIWSIDSFCGRCSAVWEGWYMGWEAVYPSLVEETKGTWQNKPQSPQKSADAHTQFCKKYQRTLEWMVLSSLVCQHIFKSVQINYFLTTNILTPHSSKFKHKWTRAGFQWPEFIFYKLCFHTENPGKSPASKAENLALKAVLGSLRSNG